MKYPVFLMHGMGVRDDNILDYWGRIPGRLQKAGYKVFKGHGDANGALESNAETVAGYLDEVLEQTGVEKVNIIAHSKGGLEARYIASTLGYKDKIASLTTISTPHHGSVTVDYLMKFPDQLIQIGCKVVDLWFKIIGDENPETYKAITLFKTKSAEEFNRKNPDAEGIFYQSYGFVMKNIFSDLSMTIPWLVVNLFEGPNDGLLPPASVKWTNFRGVFKSNSIRGISHGDEVDMWRFDFSFKKGDGISSMPDFYLHILKELEEKGF